MPMSINRTDPPRPNPSISAAKPNSNNAAQASDKAQGAEPQLSTAASKPKADLKVNDNYTQAGKPLNSYSPTAASASPVRSAQADRTAFQNQLMQPMSLKTAPASTTPAPVATTPANTALPAATQVQQSLKDLGDKIGITKPEDLAKLQPAAADLGRALDAAKNGNAKDALTALGDAASKLPDELKNTVKTAIAGEVLKNPTAKNLLEKVGISTAADLVKAGEAVPKLIDSAQAFVNGNAVDGFKHLGDALKTLPDDMKNTLVGKAIDAAPQQVKDLLTKLNLNGADLVNLAGTAMPAIAQAVQAVQDGKPGDALKALGEGVQNLSPELRNKLLGGIVDTLPLSSTVKDMLKATGDVLFDPKVRDQFAGGIDKLKQNPPDIGGFIGGMAQAAQTIANDHPESATSFLNALGKLGGPVGKFFNNGELNKAMVESGAVGKMFGAVEKLTQGDMLGALQNMGDAIGNLTSYGEKFSIDFFGRHELPFGADGLKAVGQMFERFLDIMPDKIKNQITEKLATTALGAIPVIGDVINILGAGKDVVDAIGKGDGFEIALATAKLGSSAAGVLQLSKPITQSLNAGITIAQVAKTLSDAADTVNDLKNAFAGV